MSTHNLYFEQEYEIIRILYLKIFSFFFLIVENSIYLNRHVFVMTKQKQI